MAEKTAATTEDALAAKKKREDQVNADLKRSRDRISIILEDLEEFTRDLGVIPDNETERADLDAQVRALCKRLTVHRTLMNAAKSEGIHIYYGSLNPWE